MSTPSPAFRLENVSHEYRGGKVALSRISALIPAGQTIAVLGPSGCGKTTLLSILGLLWDGRGPSGMVQFYDGQNYHNLLTVKPQEKAALRAAAFGFVLQSSYMLPHFSCLDNIGMPLAFHGWPTRARRLWAEALLACPDADPNQDLHLVQGHAPRQVSVGQRQRFGVLRALSADPAVIFADEPNSNLDPGGSAAMFNLLARWQSSQLLADLQNSFSGSSAPGVIKRWLNTHPPRPARTLVLVCHDIHAARERADRILLLNKHHQVECDFARSEWGSYCAIVEATLGFKANSTGRAAE